MLALLLQWASVVCAHYGVAVSDVGVSLSDGRAFCLLVGNSLSHCGVVNMVPTFFLHCYSERSSNQGRFQLSDGGAAFIRGWLRIVDQLIT